MELVPNSSGTLRLDWDEADRAFIDMVIAWDAKDEWAQSIRRTQLLEYGRLAVLLLADTGIDIGGVETHFSNEAAAPWLQLGALRQVLENWDPQFLPAAKLWMQQIDEHIFLEPSTKELMALYHNQRGGLLFIEGKREEALDAFAQSLKAWNHPENEANGLIAQIRNL